MNRRQVLQRLSVAGIASLTAGCVADEGPTTEPTTSTQTTSEPTTSTRTTIDPSRTNAVHDVEEVPAQPPQTDAECGDDAVEDVRRPKAHSLPEQVSGLELTASKDSVAIGDEITFSLRNVSDETAEIGTIYKYNIWRLGNDRWMPVFQTPYKAWYDIGLLLAPGAGYDWPFTFDREGLEREHEPPKVSYLVCAPLEPGTYRFVFWGAIDDSLATRFTVEPS